MRRSWLYAGLLAAAMTGSLRAAPVVSIQPNPLDFQSGASVVANLQISGLEPGRALGTFDITIGFDPTLLAFVSASFGTQLDLFGAGDISAITSGANSVELFELSLESASDLNDFQLTSFTLGTLNFSALQAGINSPLSLDIVALGDSSGVSLVGPTQGGTVPEPSSALLLLAALVAFEFGRRHRGLAPGADSRQGRLDPQPYTSLRRNR